MNNIKAIASSPLESKMNRGSELIFNFIVLCEFAEFELHFPPPLCAGVSS
jgi:hypothetical protein